jgi:hypothetical protein
MLVLHSSTTDWAVSRCRYREPLVVRSNWKVRVRLGSQRIPSSKKQKTNPRFVRLRRPFPASHRSRRRKGESVDPDQIPTSRAEHARVWAQWQWRHGMHVLNQAPGLRERPTNQSACPRPREEKKARGVRERGWFRQRCRPRPRACHSFHPSVHRRFRQK